MEQEVRKFKEIATALNAEFLYGDLALTNLNADKLQLNKPLIVVTTPTGGEDTYSDGAVFKAKQRAFIFVCKQDVDRNGYNEGVAIEEMHNLMTNFFIGLQDDYEIPDKLPYEVLMSYLDACTIGVMTTATLQPLTPDSVC